MDKLDKLDKLDKPRFIRLSEDPIIWTNHQKIWTNQNYNDNFSKMRLNSAT